MRYVIESAFWVTVGTSPLWVELLRLGAMRVWRTVHR